MSPNKFSDVVDDICRHGKHVADVAATRSLGCDPYSLPYRGIPTAICFDIFEEAGHNSVAVQTI